MLRRADRNRTLAVSDQHIFSSSLINEARFGYFSLNNTRALDEPYLSQELTSEAVGISNPALLFDDSPATRRLGHFIGRPGTNLSQFSFGGPNDSFNKRKQQTYSFSDNVTWIGGAHTLRFGGDFKSHRYDSSLPEEQATEFEKFDSITQLVTGNATEADTQFGITEKIFPLQGLQRLRRRRLEALAQADDEPRPPLRAVHVAHRKGRAHRQLRLRRLRPVLLADGRLALAVRQPRARLHRPVERADDRPRQRGRRHRGDGARR